MPVNYHNNEEGNEWWCQESTAQFEKQRGRISLSSSVQMWILSDKRGHRFKRWFKNSSCTDGLQSKNRAVLFIADLGCWSDDVSSPFLHDMNQQWDPHVYDSQVKKRHKKLK